MNKKLNKKLICELLGISEKSYYRWKEERKIFKLLEYCFSNSDLQKFLETGKKPYKINIIDNSFHSLYREFVEFIIFSEAAKALFVAIDQGVPILDKNILHLYENKKIDEYDLLIYFNNKPNENLLMYINENINNDWDIFKQMNDDRDDRDEWMKIYLDIIFLATKKDIFDIIFGQPNKDIDDCFVPIPPMLFSYYHNVDKVNNKYKDILLTIKEAIINDNYFKLPKYSAFNSTFNLKIKSFDR